jgi:hypothetical protein
MNAPAKQTEPAATTLRQIAIEALAHHDGKTTEAITEVVDVLLKKRSLLRELVGELVCEAARAAVCTQQKQARQTMMSRCGRDDVMALARGISSALLDFPLAGGLRLRDATRAQVLEQVRIYETQGRDMLRKARWLQAVAQSVPENSRVGAALSDARAVELWRSVEQAGTAAND